MMPTREAYHEKKILTQADDRRVGGFAGYAEHAVLRAIRGAHPNRG
jgi:hypothetical protein